MPRRSTVKKRMAKIDRSSRVPQIVSVLPNSRSRSLLWSLSQRDQFRWNDDLCRLPRSANPPRGITVLNKLSTGHEQVIDRMLTPEPVVVGSIRDPPVSF